jgi:signal transduction histidine kinase
VDPHRLRQVLDNLIGNAMKFCPDGAEVEIRLRQYKRTVVIEVSDTGPGIPASDLTRIFNKHYRSTAKAAAGEKSSGLGLCISKWLVELHGGRISAFNNHPGMGPGGADLGATFRVSLPVGG